MINFKKAYSLIEIIIVCSIILIISGFIIVNTSSARAIARDKQRMASLAMYQIALQEYYAKYKTYPIAAADEKAHIALAIFETEDFLSPLLQDPLSQDPNYYYMYAATGGRDYKLYCKLEKDDTAMKRDGGAEAAFYEVFSTLGSHLVITHPLSEIVEPPETQVHEWLAGYDYRRAVTIDNTQNSSILSDYQVLTVIDTASLIVEGKMQAACQDIRITDLDGITKQNYWIESGCNTDSTRVWTKAPSIAANSQKTVYFYYGNLGAISDSSLTDTLDNTSFTDIFSDTSKINTTDTSKSLKIDGGEAKLKGYEWYSNSEIVNGLNPIEIPPSTILIISRPVPAVFYKDSTWYLISGGLGGTFTGLYWNGSQWVYYEDIVAGLADVGDSSSPVVFQKDGTWYLISGEQSGNFNGFHWNGSQWVGDAGIIAGLPSITAAKPTVFQKDSVWYMISGDGVIGDGAFNGFHWNGSQWVGDAGIIAGDLNICPDVGSLAAVFQKDATWYLICGKDGWSSPDPPPHFFGFHWNGSQWVEDADIVGGAVNPNVSNLKPTVFQKDSVWYMMTGCSGVGDHFSGLNWEFVPSGTLYSALIPEDTSARFVKGQQLSFNDIEPADTDIKYQVEHYDGSWQLVPDSVLPSNSVGFDVSPIDISSIPSDYGQIRLRANLDRTILSTPSIQDWTVSYYSRKCSSLEPTISVYGEQKNYNFAHRTKIIIDNTTNSNNLYNYQVSFTIDTKTVIDMGHMRADCKDIRLSDNLNFWSDDNWDSSYPYWIESGCNTDSTKIWVKIDSISASSAKNIYMYYGNSSADSIFSSIYYTFSNGSFEDTFNDFSRVNTVDTSVYIKEDNGDAKLRGDAWYSNSEIVNGLDPIDTPSGILILVSPVPAIFYKDSTWYLISGNFGGTFTGLYWNGSQWVYYEDIVAGLADVGDSSSPVVFQKDGTWYLISGEQSGNFNGFHWNGSQWVGDAGIIAGLPSITAAKPTVFQKDSVWYMISGDGVIGDEAFYGFHWNGSQWVEDAGIIAGDLNICSDVGSLAAVFQKDATWYLICGKDGWSSPDPPPHFFGFHWNGSQWVEDADIVGGAVNPNVSNLKPTVFQKDSVWYMMTGYSRGYSGLNWEFVPSGTLYSVSIPIEPDTRFIADSIFSFNDTEPANTDIKYQIEYYDGTWQLVPDSVLPSNSVGFDVSPVNISSIPSDYGQIRLKANLSKTSSSAPSIQDWTANYHSRKYSLPEPTATPTYRFKYRKELAIDNTGNASILTDYAISFTTDTATLVSAGKMRADCADIRFTNFNSWDSYDWDITYPYWIESGCNTGSTKIWVKMDSIPASSAKNIYMYYDQESVANASLASGAFFDGAFTDTFSDETKVNIAESSNILVNDGEASLDFDSSGALSFSNLVPNGDLQTGWPNSTGVNHYTEIDEGIASADDNATYISTPDNNSTYVDKFELTSQSGISLCKQITVKFRGYTGSWDDRQYIDIKLLKADDSQIGETYSTNFSSSDTWLTFEHIWNDLYLSQSNIDGLRIEVTKRSDFFGEPVRLTALEAVVGYYETVPYYSSGTLYSALFPEDTSFRFSAGKQLSFNDTEPASADTKYQIEYYDGTWQLVPDSVLPSNSTGFDLSPVDISSVKASYGQIRLKSNLSTSDTSVSPTIQDWTANYYSRKYSSPEPIVSVGAEES